MEKAQQDAARSKQATNASRTDSAQNVTDSPASEVSVHIDGDNARVSRATVVAVKGKSLPMLWRRADGFGEKLKAAATWYQSTRLGRAMARVGNVRAFLLAGGVAYMFLFSLFAALTVGVTVVMTLLRHNPEFRTVVLNAISDALPGIIGEGPNDLVKPEQLMVDSILSVGTAITVLLALWAAMNTMSALKASIRSVAGIVTIPENFLISKLRDLAGFVVLGLTVIVTSILTFLTQKYADALLEMIGLQAVSRPTISILAVTIVIAVDYFFIIFLIRGVAGVRAPKKDLRLGALIGALGAGALRLGSSAIISVPQNPIMASATALITLLLLANLVVRFLLVITAIIVNPPAPIIPEAKEEVHFRNTPNYVTISVPETLLWDHEPATGSLIPDPTLNPDYTPPPAEQPKWGGLIGKMKRHRIERLEAKLDKAKSNQ